MEIGGITMISMVKKKLLVLLAGVLALCIGVCVLTSMPNLAKAEPMDSNPYTIEMVEGVSIRTDNSRAIRFQTKVETADINALIDAGKKVEVVTLISMKRFVPDLSLFNDSFNVEGQSKKIVFSVENGNLVDNGDYEVPVKDGYNLYNACIYNVQESNIAKDFIAVSYIKVDDAVVEGTYTKVIGGDLWTAAKAHLASKVTWDETSDEYKNVSALCDAKYAKVATIKGFDNETYELTVPEGQTVAEAAANDARIANELMVDGAAYYKGINDADVTLTEDGQEFTAKMNALAFAHSGDRWNAGENYGVAIGTLTAEDTTVIKVPETYNGKPVTCTQRYAFRYCDYLAKVILPESLTTIAGFSFDGCTNLAYLDAKGVTQNLYTITEAGNTMFTDDHKLFRDCINLETVIFGDSFKSANSNIFDVESLELPANKKLDIYLSSAGGTFNFSASSNTLWSGNVYNYDANGGCGTWKYNEDETDVILTLHSYKDGACVNCDTDQTKGLTYVYDETLDDGNGNKGGYVVFGGQRITAYTGTDKEVYIRTTYNDKPVLGIGKWAFQNNTKITKVIAPSVKYVGGVAFAGCTSLNYVDLRSFEVYDYQVSIAGWTDHGNLFRDCIALETLILGPSFRMDDEIAIFNVESQAAPESPKLNIYLSSAEGTFTTKTTANVLLSENVYNYVNQKPYTCGTWHFTDENETVIELAPENHEYENGACKNCDADQTKGLTYVYDETLDDGNGNKGGYVVFGGQRITAYTGTDKEVYIRTTYNDKPVLGIGKWAFQNNTNITKVIAPSVKYVGGVAFAGCTSLNYVDLRSFEVYDYQVSIAGYSEHGNLFRDCIALETLILGPSFRMDDEVAIFNVESQSAPESPKLNIYLSSAEGTFTTKTTANVLLSVNVYYLSNDNKPTDTTKTYWHYDKETDLAVLWE